MVDADSSVIKIHEYSNHHVVPTQVVCTRIYVHAVGAMIDDIPTVASPRIPVSARVWKEVFTRANETVLMRRMGV